MKKEIAPNRTQDRDMAPSEQKHFTLPDTKTITEWFSKDQEEMILKLCASKYENYGKYSVYEVYNEHSKSL